MKPMKSQVPTEPVPTGAVIITGCSTGLGLETAMHLAAQGFSTYATVRDPNHEAEVITEAEARGVKVKVLRLDLTDHASVHAAVAQAAEESGGIYGLVNNGGIGLRGCIEDTTPEEIRRLFEANIVGTVEVTKAVLPYLREAGTGRIITITSVGGRVSTYGVGMYCASKFAQEGFAEALYLEMAPFGLHSIIIEPGIIKTTRWDENRGEAIGASNPDSPYHAYFVESEAIADRLVQRSKTKPEEVAVAVHKALVVANPKLRYVVGKPAGAVILARRYLPNRFFEKVYFGGFLKSIEKRASQAAMR